MQDEKASDAKPKRGLPMWVQVLLYIWMGVCFVYGVKTRSFSDFIQYGLYVAGGLSIIFFFIGISIVSKKDAKNKFWRKAVLWLLLILVIPSIGGATYYSIAVTLKDGFLWLLSPTLTKGSAIILTCLLVLIFGSILFYFRLRRRALYGLSEIAIGVLVAANRISSQIDLLSTSDFYLAVLTASVYLIVRGWDNIYQGLFTEPGDAYGKAVFEYLQKRV